MLSYNESLSRQGDLAMSRSFAKLTAIAGAVLLLSLSSNSFAGGFYGNIGYGHHPIHIVIGHSGHGKHHYGHRYNRYDRHAKHYRHKHHGYNKHAYKYGHNYRHHYNQPRRYCRSGY